jgi:hypothetical protein
LKIERQLSWRRFYSSEVVRGKQRIEGARGSSPRLSSFHNRTVDFALQISPHNFFDKFPSLTSPTTTSSSIDTSIQQQLLYQPGSNNLFFHPRLSPRTTSASIEASFQQQPPHQLVNNSLFFQLHFPSTPLPLSTHSFNSKFLLQTQLHSIQRLSH